jgi:hypothetical protein
MITLKEFMEVVDYRITEGSDFQWQCFGEEAQPYTLSAWNGDHDGWSFNITFDTRTQEVYTVESHDYKNNRAYRIINPSWIDDYNEYADSEHPEYKNNAWEGVDYVDLENDDDWIQKALSIIAGEEYDTRVSVPIDFSDEELLKYMKLAHERDITFNQFIEEALRHAIEEAKDDPEGMKQRAQRWKDEKDFL